MAADTIAGAVSTVFTGIVQDRGIVESARFSHRQGKLTIRTSLSHGLRVGDSLCVNGVCLTADAIEGDLISAVVVRETLERTTLRQLQRGIEVNLEPALSVGDSLGGHWVQGHVDGCCRVLENRDAGTTGWMLSLELQAELSRYVVEKGSIAIDGVSLTVAAIDGLRLTVALIPHTLERTVLSQRRTGDQVNVEVDILAKYVERMLASGRGSEGKRGVVVAHGPSSDSGGLSEGRLLELGYSASR